MTMAWPERMFHCRTCELQPIQIIHFYTTFMLVRNHDKMIESFNVGTVCVWYFRRIFAYDFLYEFRVVSKVCYEIRRNENLSKNKMTQNSVLMNKIFWISMQTMLSILFVSELYIFLQTPSEAQVGLIVPKKTPWM